MLPGLAPLSDGLWAGPTDGVECSGSAIWTAIPTHDILRRTHELPSPGVALRVAGPDAEKAVSVLASAGRSAFVDDAPSVGRFGGRLWQPNPFLLASVAGAEPGDAVDLGCGSGRETASLLAVGWRVTAIDVHEAALARTRDLACRYVHDPGSNARLSTLCADLDCEELPHAQWDLAVSLYYLNRNTVIEASRRLRSQGRLLIEAFTDEHAQHFGRPKSADRRLRSGEWPIGAMIGEAVVESRREGMHGDRHTVQLIARKK